MIPCQGSFPESWCLEFLPCYDEVEASETNATKKAHAKLAAEVDRRKTTVLRYSSGYRPTYQLSTRIRDFADEQHSIAVKESCSELARLLDECKKRLRTTHWRKLYSSHVSGWEAGESGEIIWNDPDRQRME